jgi:methylase of polypeptide subunit release factors
MVTSQEPLAELLRYLEAANYRFTAVTPATHAKTLARPATGPLELRDIFGWNRAFQPADICPDVLELLRASQVIEERNGMLRSRVRVASLGEDLLLHSAFPTDDAASVFFGPDTYRFVRFLKDQLAHCGDTSWLVDMGAGSGAGAIAAAKVSSFDRVTMIDVNPEALRFAAINAAVAGLRADTLVSTRIPRGAGLVIANPPYMMDPAGRSYRDGGELFGGAVAFDWASQALQLLAPSGMVLLYTGAAYISGEAPLLNQLEIACSHAGASVAIEEIDSDVFGDNLDQPAYARVERIAAVGIVIKTRRAS